VSDNRYEKMGFDRPQGQQRKLVRIPKDTLVKTSYLDDQKRFPLVIEPSAEYVNPVSWAASNRELIEDHLSHHGAILFRNFNLRAVGEFEQFIEAASDSPLEYQERSSPRSRVSGNIYTSTDHPAEQHIFLHNEQSYNQIFPMKIYFFCVTPAPQGGETPIADCRKVLKRLDPRLIQSFSQRKYMYVRNFGDGFGLSWQEAFQTTIKSDVEEYCHKNEIEFEWKKNNRLRTRQIRRAIARHPRTGQDIWFNHLTFFHVTTLESAVRDSLLNEFGEDELPNQTYYGDGAAIENSVLDEIRHAYLSEATTFSWQKGDLLMLDNILTAHGRRPYVGPRKIIVGMAELFDWKNV
jgi:alpha-ketoglutarate-dependent taurine dioxygenase